MQRITFHRSWALPAAMSAILVLFATLWSSPDGWRFVALFVIVQMAITWRQRLVCSPAGLDLIVLRRRHVQWSDILGFQPASSLRGGTQILTTTGELWSPAPSSWWGGPASDADLTALESARLRGVSPNAERLP